MLRACTTTTQQQKRREDSEDREREHYHTQFSSHSPTTREWAVHTNTHTYIGPLSLSEIHSLSPSLYITVNLFPLSPTLWLPLLLSPPLTLPLSISIYLAELRSSKWALASILGLSWSSKLWYYSYHNRLLHLVVKVNRSSKCVT